MQTDGTKCKLGKWLEDTKEIGLAEDKIPALKAILASMRPNHTKLHTLAQSMQQKLTENNGDREVSQADLVQIYEDQITPTLESVRGSLHDISEVVAKRVASEKQLLNRKVASSNRNMLIVSVLALVLGIGISFFFSRSLSGQIKQAVDFATTLSSGDYSKNLDIAQKDEVGILAVALNKAGKACLWLMVAVGATLLISNVQSET